MSNVVQAMIRPRVGNFLYSEGEFRVMMEDIETFKRHGVAGVVFGVLDENGNIDIERTKMSEHTFCIHCCAVELNRYRVDSWKGRFQCKARQISLDFIF